MKQSITILSTVLIGFSLMAFGYINKNNSTPDIDLVYKIDSRFLATVTLKELHKANSIVDILPAEATESISSYREVSVSKVDDNAQHRDQTEGVDEVLNAAQKELFQTVDYSDNIYIKADIKRNFAYFDPLRVDRLTYFISVVPTAAATYKGGQSALIKYLKKNTEESTAVITREGLKPGTVSFKVTKEGTLADIQLTSTSGYTSVDASLIKAIKNMPSNWNPAQNEKGEKVEQKLVFFFGLMGC